MYSWRGAMLIMSSVLAHQCVVGALFRKTLSETTAKRAKVSNNESIKSNEICKKESSSNEIHYMEPIINWTFGFALVGYPFTEGRKRRQSIQIIKSHIRKSSVQVTNDIKRSDTVAIFRNLRLLNFNISMFLRGFAYYASYVNFVALCVDIGISKVDAAFLLSLMGICGVAARLSHGFLIDKELVTPLHFQIVTQQIAGFCCIFIGLSCNFVTLCVYVTLFGASSGIFFATTTNSIRQIVDAHLVKGGIGIAMTVACAGGLLGVPASGKIFDVTKSFTTSYYLSGCLFLVSSFLHFMDHVFVSYQRRRQRKSCETFKDRTEFECKGISLPKASKV